MTRRARARLLRRVATVLGRRVRRASVGGGESGGAATVDDDDFVSDDEDAEQDELDAMREWPWAGGDEIGGNVGGSAVRLPCMRLRCRALHHEPGDGARFASAHPTAVTCVHTSHAAWDRVWTGDMLGQVVVWSLSGDEHWVRDADVEVCTKCTKYFGYLERRRHHCRMCGGVFCNSCSSRRAPVIKYGFSQPVRVCDYCFEHMAVEAALPRDSRLISE